LVVGDLPYGYDPSAMAEPPKVIKRPTTWSTSDALNAIIGVASGDYVVLLKAGDRMPAQRLRRQAAFLDQHAHVDIVGGSHAAHESNAPEVFPELDHEIKAELLGQHPLVLGGCMIRASFVRREQTRFNPQMAVLAELNFLCNCAARGARMASSRELSLLEGAAAPADPRISPATLAYCVTSARLALWPRLFPGLTEQDVKILAEIHALNWPGDPKFAQQIIGVMARICNAEEDFGARVNAEALIRVLRREAIRMIRVYVDARAIDMRWIQRLFEDQEVAAFLAPAARHLPIGTLGQ
jgi:hypothetical protein